jgi:hypothetical protein
MSDWTGGARTNHFKVKDRAAFIEWAMDLDLSILGGKPGYVGVGTYAGWPTDRYNEATDEFEDFEFVPELAKHLAEGEVAVLMEAGHEKLCYLTGFATAVNWKGDTVSVDINDIYEKAKALGSETTKAQAVGSEKIKR